MLHFNLYIYIYIYICRVSIWGAPFTVDVSKPKPNRPNTMNLVEKRTWELGLCEDTFNGRAGSSGNWIVYNVVWEKVKARPRSSAEDNFFFSFSDTPSIELPGVFRITVPYSWNLPSYISFCSLHLGLPSVDCAGRHLSVCPIQHFPQLVVSGSG